MCANVWSVVVAFAIDLVSVSLCRQERQGLPFRMLDVSLQWKWAEAAVVQQLCLSC